MTSQAAAQQAKILTKFIKDDFMYRMPLLCWLTTTALSFSTLLAQSIPYSVSSVQGSNIITNYYDPNATQAAGPGFAPSSVANQFNQPLGKPLDASASLPSAGLSPVGSFAAMPLTPYNAAAPAQTNPYAAPAAGYASTPNYSPVTSSFATTPSVVPGTTPVQIQAPPSLAGSKAALPSHLEEPTYTFPGLVARLGRHWVGSDYLYQMPGHIGVVVEVVKSDTTTFQIDSARIKSHIMNIFSQAGITPQATAYGNQPPLPFFHVLIFATSTAEHGIAAISGRLFEKVTIDRFHFDMPGTWQAITWEQQDLITASLQQISEQIIQTSLDISAHFVHQVNYFLDLRVQQESDVKLKGGPVFAPIFSKIDGSSSGSGSEAGRCHMSNHLCR